MQMPPGAKRDQKASGPVELELQLQAAWYGYRELNPGHSKSTRVLNHQANPPALTFLLFSRLSQIYCWMTEDNTCENTLVYDR